MVTKVLSKVHLEPRQTSKMDLFGEIVDGFNTITIVEKSSIIDVR